MIRILALCSGNVCRSPLAAMLLADRLNPARFEVTSAGTSPMIGDQMPTEAQELAARMGCTQAQYHRARAVTEEDLSASDLIIGMARTHANRAIQLQPSAVTRTYTLLGLAQTVAHIKTQHVRTLHRQESNVEVATLKTITRMRGTVPRLHPTHLYDLEDPYGRSKQAYERSGRQIVAAIDQIAKFFHHALRPARNATPAMTTALIRRQP